MCLFLFLVLTPNFFAIMFFLSVFNVKLLLAVLLA